MSTSGQVTAQIGGVPSNTIDTPIAGVFIALFIGLAASHMTIFQINRRRGHKFVFNGMLFGFSMSRIMALTFRIIWANRPTDVDITLVASIFLSAGILLIYILNNLLAWRMVRSAVPSFGWNSAARLLNKVFLWAVLGLFIPSIVITVLRVKQPTMANIQQAANVISKLSSTYFLIMAVMPAFLLAFAVISRRRSGMEREEFGTGAWSTKVAILALSIAFAIIEAGFRCGTTWTPAPLATNPAWWDSKAAFYCFNFMIDIFILVLLLVGRIDRRFHVPDGSSKVASYSHGKERTDGASEELK